MGLLIFPFVSALSCILGFCTVLIHVRGCFAQSWHSWIKSLLCYIYACLLWTTEWTGTWREKGLGPGGVSLESPLPSPGTLRVVCKFFKLSSWQQPPEGKQPGCAYWDTRLLARLFWIGDKSSTENREATSSPETEVAGMKTEITDFIVTAFPF